MALVTVVSGVPRSGTSMMMQMLQAGGIPLLTDGLRQPDAHNPQGYFEYDAVKRLTHDHSWVSTQARGKAVKVIYRLLQYLPADEEYRVIFMERDLQDVFASQRKMLQSRGDSAAGQDRDRLIAAIESELATTKAWLAAQPNMPTLFVAYEAVMREPNTWCKNVAAFLGQPLDLDAMAAAIV